ncbi:unnamed protein product [Urochloa humidicola]
MKSFLFPERDEEERAELVPPPPPPPDDVDHGGGGAADHDDDPAAVPVKQQQLAMEQQDDDDQTARWNWRRGQNCKLVVVLTRSARLVIAGLVVLALLLVGSISSSWWIHPDYASSFLLGGGMRQHRRRPPHHMPSPAADLVPIPFSCGNATSAASPSPSPSPAASRHMVAAPPRCPEYFRFIHSDLSPWSETGITREAVERGRDRAAFRLLVVGGRAYVETYHRVFQTRDSFTQWGIAQLLARYPGRVPDLDLMFNCEDMPEVRAADFPKHSDAPPLFRYCKDDATLDIVFPDWSFWGWPEVNIRPWAPLLEEMAAETARLPWSEREPYAYWKGNPSVSADRRDLLRCNKTEEWNARVFAQDWDAAIRAGFRGSNLAEQCRYRYKIFVRGRSWSVSDKYILACDSPELRVDTPFEDFFSRGLVAGKHYWPIDPARKCAAIRLAVDWGNAHPAEARRMAEEGSGFAREELAMDYVYDYMLHLLTHYASLLRYKPTVPDKAVELCPEALACPAAQGRRDREREFKFMMESRERYVADYEPCTLPPPFSADELADIARRDHDVRAKVHKMMNSHGPPS